MSPLSLITSVPASCPAKNPSAKMIRGGLSEARPATAEIQEIADKVKPQLEEKTNETYEEFEAVKYKSQVVAGTNFYIKVHVGGNRYVHLKVFEGLSRENEDFKLSGYQTDKCKEDELTGL
ncbi:cystatin-A-like [Microcebus murinus]|uniref:Cystatin domain-containing protein n=1 Tax=Microcebus murinus TaxID=30608 RepID=A0A8B7HFP4_MICMU|nr:cystatin-A-like [Microcebus murinus]